MVCAWPLVRRSALVLQRAPTGRFLVGAFLITLFCWASAQAQDPPSESYADETTEEIEEITVTGSRLRRRDFSAPSPVATIDREAIEFTGQGTLETALNQMPQVIPDFNRTANNPGNGTARINLRGLGAGRTLVMLNGRRLAPSGIGSAVDVNTLPQALIERVEVITGGAAAVYGSDAVSGVVNFISRKDYDGLSLDLSGYSTEQGDSSIYDINVAYGHEFDSGRGNITLFGGYYDREETYADERELTSVPWWDMWNGELIMGGSSAVPDGIILFPRVDFGNGPAWTIFDPDGNPREYVASEDQYNYAPWNFLQIPLERYNGGLLLSYDLTDRVEVYVEAAYTNGKVRRVLAPVPGTGWMEFNTDNPIMTPATQQVFADSMIPLGGNRVLAYARRRFEELGPRINVHDFDHMRIVAGAKGEIWHDWEFDAWAIYTTSDESELYENQGSRTRWQQGLLVDPATGECFDPTGGCVPIDMFGPGRASPEAMDFLRISGLENVTEREQLLASGFIRGRLFDTWAGEAESAFGVEWRQDDGAYDVNPFFFTGDSLGFLGGPAPVFGKESVYEGYTELLLPLADGAAFAEYLALELGGRISKYDHAGEVETYKVGFEWVPVSSVRFRGMYQRSVRAPNLLEAFEELGGFESTFALVAEDDPCSAVSDPVAAGNVDKCIATGLPADQVGVFNASESPATYYWGGNPDLVPETANTYTLGVVITPEQMASLQIAIDYFDLQVEDGIGPLNATDACFDSANVENVFCDRIRRDPITLNVNEVWENNINRGELRTKGIDVQVNYLLDLPEALAIGDFGASLDVSLTWTHLQELSSQPTSFSTSLDCGGYYGWPCTIDSDGLTFPENRITTSLEYSAGDLSAHLSWRWIDKTLNAAPLRSADVGWPDPDLAIPLVEQKNYFDLGFAYEFGDHLTARLTIANLTDTDAPMMADATGGNNNTDTRMYDIFGRSYTLSFSLSY